MIPIPGNDNVSISNNSIGLPIGHSYEIVFRPEEMLIIHFVSSDSGLSLNFEHSHVKQRQMEIINVHFIRTFLTTRCM